MRIRTSDGPSVKSKKKHVIHTIELFIIAGHQHPQEDLIRSRCLNKLLQVSQNVTEDERIRIAEMSGPNVKIENSSFPSRYQISLDQLLSIASIAKILRNEANKARSELFFSAKHIRDDLKEKEDASILDELI